MADDKPDVHEDEHELKRQMRAETRRWFDLMSKRWIAPERPIVWPVGMIPIKGGRSSDD